MKRLGAFSELERRMNEAAHLERFLKWLGSFGPLAFNTHFYKGHGLAVETGHQQNLKKLIRLSHKYGLKVMAYTQFGNVMYEDMGEEVPNVEEWARKNIFDQNATMGSQEFRWRVCPTNTDFIEYLKKCVKLAIEEFGFDGIFFDNFSYIGDFTTEYRAYEGCFCDRCQERFREFLKRKYPDPAEHFGISSFDSVVINRDYLNTRDPLVREYHDYKDELLRGALEELYGYVKQLNAKAAVFVNSASLPMTNPYAFKGLLDISCWEDEGFPRWEYECMVNLVHPCKVASALGYTMGKCGYYIPKGADAETWFGGIDHRVSMAEGMAFGGHSPRPGGLLYHFVTGAKSAEVENARSYLRFYVKHKRFYEEARSAANVAILYPHKAIIYDFDHHWGALRGMEQTCLQNGIPFELVFPEELPERINDFDILLIPDYPCLEEENISVIRNWVAEGGGLYASGKTSLTDEHFQQRLDYALGDLFGTNLEKEGLTPSFLNIVPYGKGRVAFASSNPEKGVFLDEDGRPFKDLAGVSFQRKVRVRLNPQHGRLARTIGELGARGLPVEVVAPPSVAVDAYYKNKGLLLHLLNYEWRAEKRNILVRVNPQFFRAKSARVYSPDYNSQELRIMKGRQFSEFILPRLVVYSFIEFK